MSQFGALGEALENVEKNVKQAVKQGVKQQVKAVAQSAKGQFTSSGQGQAQAADGGSGTNEAVQQQAQQTPGSDQATKDFVNELYAPSQSQGSSASAQATAGKASQFVQNQMKAGKTPEEAQQLEALRKRLHDETYYIPLTKRKPQDQEQQEKGQKKEEEKMEKLQVDDKKKQKDQPIAVQMGQQHAEKYPGASG